MSIKIVDGFDVISNVPIDSRIVASNSAIRDAIEYKYDGLKVFVIDDRFTYVWNDSTSSWGLDSSDITGSGTEYILPKWKSTQALTQSSIISYPSSVLEINQKIGFGVEPVEAFQIRSNYTDVALGTSSMPFVIHKGQNTVLANNWRWDQASGQEKIFATGFSSETIRFNRGSLDFSGRTANSGLLNNLFNVGNTGTVSLHSYVNFQTTSDPTSITQSLYFGDRFKVFEEGNKRTISEMCGVYVAILTQTSSNTPTITLLESTIGTGSWSYVSAGIYNLNITGAFKNTIDISGFCGPYTSSNVFFGNKHDNDNYRIRTLNVDGGFLKDDSFFETFVEIKTWFDVNVTTSTTTTTTTAAPTTTTTTTSTTTTSTTAAPTTTSTTTTTTTAEPTTTSTTTTTTTAEPTTTSTTTTTTTAEPTTTSTTTTTTTAEPTTTSTTTTTTTAEPTTTSTTTTTTTAEPTTTSTTTTTTTAAPTTTTSTTTSTTTLAPAGLQILLNVQDNVGITQSDVSVWYAISAVGDSTQPSPNIGGWTLLNSNLTVPVCPSPAISAGLIQTSTFPCTIYMQVIQGATRSNIYRVGYFGASQPTCQAIVGSNYTISFSITNGLSGLNQTYPLQILFPVDVVPITTTSTTTTTTTAEPTTTSTTTTTTTAEPTTTSTTTTTTTLTLPDPRYSTANASNACDGGLLMTSVSYIGGVGLCTATGVECNQFLSEIAGITVWVSSGGQVRRGTVDSPNTSGIVTFDEACASCVLP
jgi:hypothetical protein